MKHKKLLIVIVTVLALLIASPVYADPPSGSPGWSQVNPGQGGSENPGPGPGGQ